MLVGRLTSKPQLRYTSSNLPYTRFNIAVNRPIPNSSGEREADFISILVWRKQAEVVCQYLDKGSLVSVEGRIRTGSYTDKDGNRRYTWDVVADSINFLESKAQVQNRQNFGYGYTENVSPYDYQNDDMSMNDMSLDQDPFADFGDSVSIDDNFLE